MSTTVKLKHTTKDPVRLSFPDVFEAVEYEKGDGKFRYNATFLIVPGGNNDKAVKAAIKAELVEQFAKKADEKEKQFAGNPNKNCYLSGDSKEYEGYQGMMTLTSHRKQKDGKPGVFDCTRAGPDGKPMPLVVSDGKPYAGCYVNATVDIYVQKDPNPGVRCGLKGVFFAADGDAFSGAKAAAADDFDIEEGADSADDLA